MSDINGSEAAPSLDYITPDDGFDPPASDDADEGVDTGADDGDQGDDNDPDLDLDLGDETGKTGDETAEDLEEYEFEGKKAKIPTWLKPQLMMQADYTRKTQEVAATRKELESQAAAIEQHRQTLAQQAEMHQANIQEVAKLVNLNEHLAQYEQVDWQALEAEDPFRAQAAWREYQQLERARNNLAGELQQKQHQAQQDQHRRHLEAQQASQAEIAKRAEETVRVLQEKVPGWNEKVATEVRSYAQEVGGYTPQEIFHAVGDPRAFVLLHKAMQYDRAVDRAAKRAQAQKQQEQIAPLTPIAKGRASPAPAGLDDRLSADEWVRRRNEQDRKRGR